MFRAGRWLLILPLLAAAGGCEGVSQWLAGVDTARYSWEPAPGQSASTLGTDLARCLAQSPAAPAGGGIAIDRADASPVVEACMADKGYRKVYQSRLTML